jgi:hypothetical protein
VVSFGELAAHGLGDLAASGRAAWREDEEEWTRAARQRWEHEQTLGNLVGAVGRRGFVVTLRLARVSFTGTVAATGDDVLVVRTAAGAVDVALGRADLVMHVEQRSRMPGRRPARTSLRSRLLEWERRRIPVVIGTSYDELRGLVAVGRDHVVLRRDEHEEVVLPLASIAWVRAVQPDDRH